MSKNRWRRVEFVCKHSGTPDKRCKPTKATTTTKVLEYAGLCPFSFVVVPLYTLF